MPTARCANAYDTDSDMPFVSCAIMLRIAIAIAPPKKAIAPLSQAIICSELS
ncbi:hypothetical protein [Aerosakkonema funiforme]|uniref:Uncharacterized protein n=1 Tax=Aerosakkonema funiforme FACHB-1375 TaxID=2949571 RepID=A0A926VBA7_9CYAN|nr:hypothetical protein [Aerosakkonema funiforme]MBD2180183.1 hypothetical protein [Aerosakkonema funiforme FACHB-1375]